MCELYCLTVAHVRAVDSELSERGGCWLWQEAVRLTRGSSTHFVSPPDPTVLDETSRFVAVVGGVDEGDDQRNDERLYLVFRRRPETTPVPYLVLADVWRMCIERRLPGYSLVAELVNQVRVRDMWHIPPLPTAAFTLFAKDKRAAIQSANPQLGSMAVTEAMKAMWRSRAESDEEKQRYEQIAAEDKRRYDALVEQQQAARRAALEAAQQSSTAQAATSSTAPAERHHRSATSSSSSSGTGGALLGSGDTRAATSEGERIGIGAAAAVGRGTSHRRTRLESN